LITFLLLWPLPSGSQPAAKANDELQYTVIVSRHGVRTPTAAPAALAQYSAEPWPEWGAPPGYLTARGRDLMKIFGAFYRSYLEDRQTLRGSGCSDAGRVYFWADNEQRTLETARGLAEGMFPGCQTSIHSLPEDEADPLFQGLTSKAGDAGRATATAAVLGSIGGHPEDLMDLYRNEFQELNRVLTGCATPEKCAEGAWLRPAIRVGPGRGDNLVDITGPLRTASTLTENLLLEYTQGIDGEGSGMGKAGCVQPSPHHGAAHSLRGLGAENSLRRARSRLQSARSHLELAAAIRPRGTHWHRARQTRGRRPGNRRT
jgi:4-phytase/acid phosphatase